MAAFFDHYWWAVFLALIFTGAVVLKPRRDSKPRGKPDHEPTNR